MCSLWVHWSHLAELSNASICGLSGMFSFHCILSEEQVDFVIFWIFIFWDEMHAQKSRFCKNTVWDIVDRISLNYVLIYHFFLLNLNAENVEYVLSKYKKCNTKYIHSLNVHSGTNCETWSHNAIFCTHTCTRGHHSV